jgi:RNA polymerase sigma-70 factor (ECF subfamily)
MSTPPPEDAETVALLARLEAGDRAALDQLLARHRGLMWQLVDRRLDGRLRGRVDTSDIVQDAQVELARRIDDFLARKPMPFRVWAYRTAYEHLLRQRRMHTADRRDAGREQVLPDHSSVQLAGLLAGGGGTASQQMMRGETAAQVQQALLELAEPDREVLLLRLFEGLSNQEVAQLLDLDPDTASKRYGRALLRLRQALAARGEG